MFLQALAHVQSWRGKKQITAGKLLVELWKKEETNMGVARDKIGKVTGNHLFTLLSLIYLYALEEGSRIYLKPVQAVSYRESAGRAREKTGRD